MGIDIEADDRALRVSRRARAVAQMEAHDLDVLVLGRQANVRYITGAPQLWVVGTRPFGPICMFVRATGEIHLNSTWDEGIPEEIPHEKIRQTIDEAGQPLLESVALFDLYKGSQVPQGKKSLAFRLSYSAGDRTLTNEEVFASHQQIIAALATRLNATLR